MGVYLSKANTTKDTTEGENNRLKFTSCSMQGWRINMEDAHIADIEQGEIGEIKDIFGVFDGHGGQEVAKFCAKHFAKTLRNNEAFKAGDYAKALEQTFLKMDELILAEEGQEELKRMKMDSESGISFAGCTANVVLVTPTHIYCANAGDSRAVMLWENGEFLALSKDHKPDGEIERARIEAAGGYINNGRVNDNLNLTRAIGDFEYKRGSSISAEKQIITAFPDVSVTKLEKKPKLLVLGCDGIWETVPDPKICETLQKKIDAGTPITTAAEELLDSLVAKDTSEGVGCDNMTCVVVQFK